ncbi:MAG: hypothetical protein K5866_06445 [Treponema sp.]|nr:hypothetical protein [Treponema sp.]
MMKKEAKIYENPIGQYIEIDGHKMCLYTEGAGDHTLIFLFCLFFPMVQVVQVRAKRPGEVLPIHFRKIARLQNF